jgi:hypothetical protein
MELAMNRFQKMTDRGSCFPRAHKTQPIGTRHGGWVGDHFNDIAVLQFGPQGNRRLVDPAARDDGDVDAGFEGNSLQKQEDPWTEDEAFQQTGSVFFSGEKLKDHIAAQLKAQNEEDD